MIVERNQMVMTPLDAARRLGEPDIEEMLDRLRIEYPRSLVGSTSPLVDLRRCVGERVEARFTPVRVVASFSL